MLLTRVFMGQFRSIIEQNQNQIILSGWRLPKSNQTKYTIYSSV